MHVESADIRFQCEQCGQHLVVEAAAEGLTMDCPICNTGLTIPAPPPAKEARKHPIIAATGDPVAPFADSGAEFLREELIDASLLNGKLGADVTKAREESTRLQRQLEELTEEHERLYASATHAQRELKTFQTERQQLKSEAATFRQRLSAAEDALATRIAELEQLRGELAASQHEHAAAAQSLAGTSAQLAAAEQLVEETRQRHEALDSRLAAETHEHGATQAQLAEAAALSAATDGARDRALGQLRESEAALAAARQNIGELAHERTELQTRLDDASQRSLAAAEGAEKTREGLETQLRGEREKLQAAGRENQELVHRSERLERDAETLRGDLKESQAGREIIEIRDQLQEAVAERERLRLRAETGDGELLTAKFAAEKMRVKLEETQCAHDAAREEAQALRDSRSIKDNEILRGIVARLNADLAQRTAETTRMKRAQYALKVVYGLFGVGLLAVLAFALKVLPRLVH